MTIKNQELCREYLEATADGCRNDRDAITANAVDAAFDELTRILRENGIDFPNDDRLLNAEVEVYRAIKFGG